jgi:hypothetical protein
MVVYGNWLSLNISPLLSMAGIALDMTGASLVAYEVLNRFRGRQFSATANWFDPEIQLPPSETPDYQAWNRARTRNMRLGLVLLLVGFALQFAANWLQLK